MTKTDACVMEPIADVRHQELIGRGGYGMVYRATDATTGQLVAVKVLTTTTRQTVERELQALAALSGHANVVDLHRFGTTSTGRPYLVLEYCDGGSLADLVAAQGSLPWDRATEIAIQVAGALAVAHANGVLHRDLKPSNILLATDTPKLADFGLAAVVGGVETGSAPVMASLAHAAPEVLDGARADARSEVYSLSSTVYELLCGRAPFVNPNDPTILPALARIAREPVPALDPDQVPSPIADALVWGLAKDPDARPQDMAAWIVALNAARVDAGARAVGVPLESTAGATPTVDGPPPPPPDADLSVVESTSTRRRRRPSRRMLVAGAAMVAVGTIGTGMVTAAASIDSLDDVTDSLSILDTGGNGGDGDGGNNNGPGPGDRRPPRGDRDGG